MKKLQFNPIQIRIMQVLWDRGQITAQEITDILAEGERVPHSTVQSHLRFLERKGAIKHDTNNRTFVYRALVEHEQMKTRTLREVIDQVFSGSAESLVLSLASDKFLTRKELEKIITQMDDNETS